MSKFHSIKVRIAILLLRVGLLPAKWQERTRVLWKRRECHRRFRLHKLVWDDRGVFCLHPKPDKKLVMGYYEETYWDFRTDKGAILRERDITHYQHLKKLCPELFLGERKRVLNFGSGHGGLSVLLHVVGHSVVNVEPAGVKPFFPEHWECKKDLNDATGAFDLIYSSHSLEHVFDLEETLSALKQRSHGKTLFFIEVPNCSLAEAQKVAPPHTYYFTMEFFRRLFAEHRMCSTFHRNDSLKSADGEEGGVIRFVGTSLLSKP